MKLSLGLVYGRLFVAFGPREAKMDDVRISRRVVISVVSAMGLAWAGAAQAASVSFKVPLTGAQSVPPVDTSGSGTADLTWDPSTRVVTWNITYGGLSSPVTMAHFHGPAKQGQNAPVVIWLTSKTTPPSSPITGNATLTPQQAQQFLAGEWYVNVHTQSHPAGEIRGQVVPPKG
jgi:CHRD domain